MKTETCKLYSRVFWIFSPGIIKVDPYNFELYRFKVGVFLETQCRSVATETPQRLNNEKKLMSPIPTHISSIVLWVYELFVLQTGHRKKCTLFCHMVISCLVLCEYSKFRIESNSYFSICIDSKRVQLFEIFEYLPSLISYLKKLKKASFLTEWGRFFTLATTHSNQQNQCYIGPLWPTKYWNSSNRNHNSAVP